MTANYHGLPTFLLENLLPAWADPRESQTIWHVTPWQVLIIVTCMFSWYVVLPLGQLGNPSCQEGILPSWNMYPHKLGPLCSWSKKMPPLLGSACLTTIQKMWYGLPQLDRTLLRHLSSWQKFSNWICSIQSPKEGNCYYVATTLSAVCFKEPLKRVLKASFNGSFIAALCAVSPGFTLCQLLFTQSEQHQSRCQDRHLWASFIQRTNCIYFSLLGLSKSHFAQSGQIKVTVNGWCWGGLEFLQVAKMQTAFKRPAAWGLEQTFRQNLRCSLLQPSKIAKIKDAIHYSPSEILWHEILRALSIFMPRRHSVPERAWTL